MPANFPTTPTINQTYTYAGVTWSWTGNRWQVQSPGAIGGGSGAVYDVASTSTGYFDLPSGNTQQRPSTPDTGMIRYNSTTGFAEVYTSVGWGSFGAQPPSISSVTPATYNGESGTLFTVNGANFTADAVVKFIDNAGVEYTAAVVAFVNSSQLTATTPQDFTVAQEPLDVKVVQASGQATRLDCIDCGGTPTWVTAAGSLGNFYKNASVNISIQAADPDSGGTVVSYTVSSGSLPSGLTLSNIGAIAGTAPNPANNTTYNFAVYATDNANNQSSTRSFSMTVKGNQIFQPVGTTRLAALTFDNQNNINSQAGGSSISLSGSLTYISGGPQDSSYYATNWIRGSNFLQIGGLGNLSSSTYTFIAWYKGTQTDTISSTYQPPVVIFGDPRGSVYGGIGLDSGKIAISCGNTVRGTTTVADNNWHCLAWAWRSNRYIDAYVDGILEATADVLATVPSQYLSSVMMDYIGTGYPYAGVVAPTALDGIQVYSGGLTQAQIQAIFNGG